MKCLRLLFFLGYVGLAQSAELTSAPIAKDGLTGDQARQVLIVVLKHEKFQLNKQGMAIDGPFKVDQSIPSQRGFWEFGLTYDSPKYGATQVLGRYAVSRFTGDVWETNLCKHFDFPALSRLQARIELNTGKTRNDEAEARRGLGCVDE